MAKATSHRLSDNVRALARPLDARRRRALAGDLRALLVWQRTLGAFPRIRGAPDATPYVSLYARGTLRGCYGSHEGPPAERLARAFLLALADTRYGGIDASERADLAAEVAYVRRARPVRADEAPAVIEPGTHGIALVDQGAATVLLPSVARERGYDARGMLELLARKAKRATLDEGVVWLLDVDEVSSRDATAASPARAARRWLEALVGARGEVAFQMDASGALLAEGTMRHGRAAVAIEALAALGSRRAATARAWLAAEIARGLRRGGPSWPERADMVLGTLALAARAGVETPLEAFAGGVDAASCSPWHAAQAASVLGPRTPSALWDACLRGLEAHPASPYALLAARARGDARVVETCARALVGAIRSSAPHAGGLVVTPIPETALTAAAVEALANLPGADARRAVRAGRAFVLARQGLDVPASLPACALGAFRASPVAPLLRCDVTGHAVLAALV
jgi:AMMECR1 domain-containing protein